MISDIAWADGSFVRCDEMSLSPATHSLSYGTSVFEGIRSYGGNIFKCEDHVERLRRSADVFGHTVPYSNADLTNLCYELLKVNKLADAYIKFLVFYDDSDVSFKAQGCSSKVVAIALPFPSKSASEPYRLATATWRRAPASCHPYQAKTSSTYALSYLSYHQKAVGYDDVIFLSTTDTVCESSGSNVFFIKGDDLFTPTTDLALAGITRRVIIDDLCPRLNVSVTERDISYTELESFDGAFLCGTAMEITRISQIDEIRYKTSALVGALATEYHNLTNRRSAP
ncbi:aminotransferase class IV [Rhodococcus tibetensis]|uniref:Aminotransferase class IV n=1 Tax=Rhodococcus tibetensis TaxID=2965064 RepID=A0ABT1QED6_9NOCA|nr:aminotransferase class IV [Rhodococcus sp. FXJ9.536]MCQ4120653.1 aminotransferase class IV [Rhodococcus sp. FXJ9.536]